MQAEALRSKAQRPEVSRSATQAARYAYYHGRIQAVQLDYTAASDSLQQALRKVWQAAHAQSCQSRAVCLVTCTNWHLANTVVLLEQHSC